MPRFFRFGRRRRAAQEPAGDGGRQRSGDLASDLPAVAPSAGQSAQRLTPPPSPAPSEPDTAAPLSWPEMNRASMFSVSRRRDWAPTQPPHKFMGNVQRASANLRFDLERKCKFAHQFRGEIEDYLNARRSDAAGFEGAVGFLNLCRDRLHDYEHVLSLEDFQNSKSSLASLSVADRRRIESFYSDFFTAVRGLERVLVRRGEARANADRHEVEAALADAFSQIEHLGRAMEDFLKP